MAKNKSKNRVVLERRQLKAEIFDLNAGIGMLESVKEPSKELKKDLARLQRQLAAKLKKLAGEYPRQYRCFSCGELHVWAPVREFGSLGYALRVPFSKATACKFPKRECPVAYLKRAFEGK